MSETNNATVEEMIKARDRAREDFIADRALYEQQFNTWYEKFLKCTKLHEEVTFDFHGWTIQNQVPELYVESPNEQIANEQMQALEAKIRQIDELAHSYNLKAHQKHLELIELRAQQNS